MIEYKCEHTERVDPRALKPHPRNPNKHPSKQIDALCANIERFGWRHPIVVSKRSGLIICGHARRQAAEKLGCDAPVDYQDFESDVDELAVLMADKFIPELAEMDTELKAQALEYIEAEDINLDVIGVFGTENPYDSMPEIPEIQIEEKLSLDRVTLFVEETIKPEVMSKLRKIVDGYDKGLVRIVT